MVAAGTRKEPGIPDSNNHTENHSRRIYEEIFAAAISQSSSSANDSNAQPPTPLANAAAAATATTTNQERYSFLTSSGASCSASYCSAPTDEEEWTDRTHRQYRALPTPSKPLVPEPVTNVSIGDGHTTPPRTSYTTAAHLEPIDDSAHLGFIPQTPPPPKSPAPSAAGATDANSTPGGGGGGGGRLWRLAGEIAAAKKAALLEKTRAGPVGHLAESFMERMRSRADPNAQVAPPTPPRPTRTYYGSMCPQPQFVSW
jgi:hypothetical protein